MKSAVSSERKNARDGAAMLASLAIAACGPSRAPGSDASSTDTSSGEEVSMTVFESSPLDEGLAESEASDENITGFIENTDLGAQYLECDAWVENCPAGEKCTFWGEADFDWIGTKCIPIAADARQVGEACVVEGWQSSGVDNCDIGAFCHVVDASSLEGMCLARCLGSEADPVCPIGSDCALSSELTPVVCLPYCDALLQDCGENKACVPGGVSFVCVPDLSGDAGAFGQPCEYLWDCNAGLFCAIAETVPGCGYNGCCNAFCDITALNECPGAGQQCIAWYSPGMAPPGHETLGVCTL